MAGACEVLLGNLAAEKTNDVETLTFKSGRTTVNLSTLFGDSIAPLLSTISPSNGGIMQQSIPTSC